MSLRKIHFQYTTLMGGWLDDKRKEERKKTVGEYNNILKRIYGQADYE